MALPTMASPTERPTAMVPLPQMVTARQAMVDQMEPRMAMELPPPRVPPTDTADLQTATAAAHQRTGVVEEGKTAVRGVTTGVAAAMVAPGDRTVHLMGMELQATPTGRQVATDRQTMANQTERRTATEPLRQTAMALPAVVSQMERQMTMVLLPQTAMALLATVDQREPQMATGLLQQMVTALLTTANQMGHPADMERPAVGGQMARRMDMVLLPQIATVGQTGHQMAMAPLPQMVTALPAMAKQMARGGPTGTGGTRCKRRKR